MAGSNLRPRGPGRANIRSRVRFPNLLLFFFSPNLFSAPTKWAAKAILYTVNNGFMFFKWVFGRVIGFRNGTTVRSLICCMVLRHGYLIYCNNFICIEELKGQF